MMTFQLASKWQSTQESRKMWRVPGFLISHPRKGWVQPRQSACLNNDFRKVILLTGFRWVLERLLACQN